MNDTLRNRRETEALIRNKLIELIRLSAEQGIDIERLIYEALDICDVEPP